MRTLRLPKQEVGNPWNASTMEWLPNEDYATRSTPQVASRDPLWDNPGLAKEVEAGQHWLPNTATGLRETIITSPVDARALYVQVLPGDSWWPLAAAVGTAGFFLLLTIEWTVVAWICGLVAIASVVLWMWQTDSLPAQREAQIGEGVMLPVGQRGPASHSWWGTMIMLVVDATIFASFLFAHIHISMALQVCPPPGTRLPQAWWPLLSCGLLLGGSLLVEWARRAGIGDATDGRTGRQRWLCGAVLVALACVLGAFGTHLYSQSLAGLDPTATAWGATVAWRLRRLAPLALAER